MVLNSPHHPASYGAALSAMVCGSAAHPATLSGSAALGRGLSSFVVIRGELIVKHSFLHRKRRRCRVQRRHFSCLKIVKDAVVVAEERLDICMDLAASLASVLKS